MRNEKIKELSKTLGIPEERIQRDFYYLDRLRKSGIVNMFGAAPHLRDFHEELTRDESKAIVVAWIDSFDE